MVLMEIKMISVAMCLLLLVLSSGGTNGTLSGKSLKTLHKRIFIRICIAFLEGNIN